MARATPGAERAESPGCPFRQVRGIATVKLRRECAKWLNALTALTNVADQADRLAAVSSTAAAVGHYRVLSLAVRPASESGAPRKVAGATAPAEANVTPRWIGLVSASAAGRCCHGPGP